jgi:phosphatidylserine/phosphatidylglycerophosphate/cardiolipin synthase-like enzyme
MSITHRLLTALALTALMSFAAPSAARAQMQERLCDPQSEDCRAPLLNLIRNEKQGIDVAFWYMVDARYSNEIVLRWKAGVPVRVLVDSRANSSKPNNATTLQQLKDAGIPMRNKTGGSNLHWKMMLFHGQNTVEFSKANYSSESFVAITPNVNWTDEAIYFSTDSALTNTFRTKFEDLWIDTNKFTNYANINGPLVRKYGIFPAVSWMNFPPFEDFATRAIARYNAEPSQIDVIVFRVTDNRHADAMINAVKRGVKVRLLTEPQQYRDTTKLEHSYNIDRMHMAGVQVKSRNHTGLLHEAAVVMHGLGEVIFGSSNWSPQSGNYQNEHNLFYKPSVNKVLDTGQTFFQWFKDQFERKWTNTSGFVPFTPLAPTNPAYSAPSNGAAGLPYTVTLKWDGGNWAYKYDIYFGTSSNPPLLAGDVPLGSPETGVMESYTIPNLAPGTTYYWRVVGKTMANMMNSGSVWSFTTAASSGGTGSGSDIVLYPGKASVRRGTWEILSDSSAAGSARIHQPDAGVAKVLAPLASPSNYFEMSFNAQAGVPYQLWFRSKADNNSYLNDSVWVQFTNSVDGTGTPAWRIGTTGGFWIGLEECSGCGVQGWGWHDNGYGVGVRGAPVYFTSTGVQTIRIQQREDGISIDQLLLSPAKYRTSSPGATKNDTVILPESGGTTGGSTTSIDEIVIHAKAVSTLTGRWAKETDTTAADTIKLRNPDAGAAKLTTASAAPASYFEKTFNADAGKPYHIWVRMKADNNAYTNDSVFVQFSGSQTGSGTAAWRIGTTDALSVSLEEGNGAGVQGWGWNDNAYGSLGTPVYFSRSGTQTIRVQVREDGVAIDQIVLSAARYLNTSPGALKNDTRIITSTVP